jgi:hypothetical protein
MLDDDINNTLKQGLNFLEGEGFKLSDINKTESQASGIFYTISYISEKTRRGIIVSYFPKFDYATASIKNLDNYFNFSDAGAMKITHPEYALMSGKKEEKLANYLKALQVEIMNKYLSILQGEPFQNDEFDWSSYK